MKKIPVSKLIDFSRKPQKSRITFLKHHNKPKEPTSGGGDYWAPCLSALNNAFKNDDNSFITKKIQYLVAEIKKTPHKITKDMFQRNIDILSTFELFEFSKWIKINKLSFLNKNSAFSVIHIKGIPIQVTPNHIFTFVENGVINIGAISFVSKLGGYSLNELAAFTDAMYKYLKINYSNKYKINASLCLAIDTHNMNEISYEDIINRKVVSILESTINEVIKVA